MRSPSKYRIRKLVIEFFLYGVLLVVYFLTVLQFLAGLLTRLFHQNLWLYSVAALLLIIIQAVVLEWITSFLVDRLDQDKSE